MVPLLIICCPFHRFSFRRSRSLSLAFNPTPLLVTLIRFLTPTLSAHQDTTKEAISRINDLFVGIESKSDQGFVCVTKASKVTGEASIVFTRGKKKVNFEFEVGWLVAGRVRACVPVVTCLQLNWLFWLSPDSLRLFSTRFFFSFSAISSHL